MHHKHNVLYVEVDVSKNIRLKPTAYIFFY